MDINYERHQSARMFESEFFEFFSKVHPSVPFIFYIPIVAGLLVYGLLTGVTTWALALGFVAVGWVVWDVMEYAIHRWLFHWPGNGPVTRWIYSTHLYHHRYPDDEKRLVMPLGASIPLSSLIGLLLYFVHRPAATLPLFCGIIVGYLFYDFTHWSTHFREPLTRWGRNIRSRHMAHHFADPNLQFGISHRWIDAVIGTLKRR